MALLIHMPLNNKQQNLGTLNITPVNHNVIFTNHYSYYNGSNAFINIQLPNDIGNTWSHGIWYRYERENETAWLCPEILNTNGSDSDIKLGFWLKQNENRFESQVNGKYNSNINFTNEKKRNEWHHLFATYNGSSLLTYVDGQLRNTYNSTQALLSRTNLTIGGRATNANGSTANQLWRGCLYDFRLYDEVLSAEQILEIYNQTKNDLNDNLILWIPGNNGILFNQGLTDYLPTSSGYTSDNSGKLGKCLHITGPLWTNVPFSKWDYKDNTGHSISFGGWFKFNYNEVLNKIATLTYNTNSRSPSTNLLGWNSYGGFSVEAGTTNEYTTTPTSINSLKIYTYLRDKTSGQDTSNICFIGNNETIKWDEWFHIMITYNHETKTIKCYLNNTLVSTQIITRAITNVTENQFGVNIHNTAGGNGPSTNFPMYINDIRLYTKCLTEKEIKKIYQTPVVHYQLNNTDIQPNLNLFNTVMNTAVVDKTGYRANQSATLTLDKMSNGFVCITSTSTQSSSTPGIKFPTITLKANTNYTLSGWIQSNCNALLQDYTIGSGNGAQADGINSSVYRQYSTPTYIYCTFNSGSATSHRFFGFMSVNGSGTWWIKLSRLQLTEGDTLLPYIPNALTNNKVYDGSGFKYDGTSNANALIEKLSPRYKYNKRIESEAASITIGNLNQICPEGNFTFNVWFKRKTGDTGGNWASIFGGPSGFELETRMSNNTTYLNYIHPYSWGGGSTSTPNDYSIEYSLDHWHMLTMVRTASNAKFYLDGELKKTGSAGAIPSGNYFLGSWSTATGQWYMGNLSDLRIFNTILSDNDIMELYQMGHIPS